MYFKIRYDHILHFREQMQIHRPLLVNSSSLISISYPYSANDPKRSRPVSRSPDACLLTWLTEDCRIIIPIWLPQELCCSESRDRSTTYRSTKHTLKTTILLHSGIFQLAEELRLPPEQAIIASTTSEPQRKKKGRRNATVSATHTADGIQTRKRTGSGRTAMARGAWGKGEDSVPGDKYMHQADAGEERPSQAPRPCAAALTAPGQPVLPLHPIPPPPPLRPHPTHGVPLHCSHRTAA